jgi:hypothetical protein
MHCRQVSLKFNGECLFSLRRCLFRRPKETKLNPKKKYKKSKSDNKKKEITTKKSYYYYIVVSSTSPPPPLSYYADT